MFVDARFAEDGRTVVVSSSAERAGRAVPPQLRRYDARTGRPLGRRRRASAREPRVPVPVPSRRDRLLFTAARGRHVRGRRGNAARAARIPVGAFSAGLSPDGRSAALGAEDGSVAHPRSPHRRAPDASGPARGSGPRTGVQRLTAAPSRPEATTAGCWSGTCASGTGARDPDRPHRPRHQPRDRRRRAHALHRRAGRPDHRLGHRRRPPPRTPVPGTPVPAIGAHATTRPRSRSARPAGPLPPGFRTAACACTTRARSRRAARPAGDRGRTGAARSSSAPTAGRSP